MKAYTGSGLYRAKCKSFGKWVHGSYSQAIKYNHGVLKDVIILDDGVPVLIQIETLSVFTGVCDTEGNKIFSGDIVAEYWDFEERDVHRVIKVSYGHCTEDDYNNTVFGFNLCPHTSEDYLIINNVWDSNEEFPGE